MNIMAAINVCKILEVPDDIIIDGILNFKGLEHRIEYVGKFNNIHFYNDSISTIPESAIAAVKTLKDVDTLILGGYDRGVDYTNLIEFLLQSSISNLIFIAQAGKRIYDELKTKQKLKQKLFYVNDFDEVVKIAKEKTRINSICLLSPAAASYGMFVNFEERGKVFKKLVSNLKS
jgi:UDP-N-acetylmuramoylalanine--D-glutamate ligase